MSEGTEIRINLVLLVRTIVKDKGGFDLRKISKTQSKAASGLCSD
jgi:hypothetical protein